MSTDAGHSATGPEPAQEPEEPQRPAKRWKLALISLIGVFVVLAAYDVFSSSGELGSAHVAAVSSTATPAAAGPSAGASSSAPPSATPASAAPVSPIPSAKPTKSPVSSPASRPLSVASIVAFGPGGTSDGDNPGNVFRINGGGQPWYSSWYTTPEFGNLQAGTGLLLDMGNTVKVSSVRLVLGSQVGADVQVRVGDTPALAGLSTVATAADVGGTVRLSTSAGTNCRYVLIWFTTLPPNGQGKYQISVYGATVDGTAGT